MGCNLAGRDLFVVSGGGRRIWTLLLLIFFFELVEAEKDDRAPI
jgi:hypothetical protein